MIKAILCFHSEKSMASIFANCITSVNKNRISIKKNVSLEKTSIPMEQINESTFNGVIDYDGIFISCFQTEDSNCFHAMPDHALFYMYSGQQKIIDKGQEIDIYPGECAFIRRDHRITFNKNAKDGEPYKGISMTFRRPVLREFYKNLNPSDIPTDVKAPKGNLFKIPVRPDIMSLFHSLTPYFNANVKPTDEMIKLKLHEGIITLLNTNKFYFPLLFDFNTPWKIDILEYLNENYMYDLTQEEIAHYTGRSLATFKRDFAQVSDLTPQRWVINKRLRTAQELLEKGNVKASDVYLEVGFKNLSHFYTAYKKEFGYQPSKQ